ncbi:hypothetical protein JTB14_010160 [Gonioctena quinquepunctata]|nr:hypothetical protein JTB14_010160 [Gonioctena quinquepunctata]
MISRRRREETVPRDARSRNPIRKRIRQFRCTPYGGYSFISSESCVSCRVEGETESSQLTRLYSYSGRNTVTIEQFAKSNLVCAKVVIHDISGGDLVISE